MTQYYHLFPFERVPQGSRIIIYGAGEVGQWYLTQMEQTGFAKVVAIADKAWDKYPPMGAPLISPQAIGGQEYDYVLVSIEKPNIARAVANELQTVYGLESEKIILGSESLCVVPKFLKAGRDLPQLAFESQGIPIAIQVYGGLGDTVVLKRKVEEILKWDRRLRADLYADDKRQWMFQAVYGEHPHPQINQIIFGSRSLFDRNKDKYAIALWFPQAVDLEIRFREDKLQAAPNLLERCLRIQEQSNAYGHITEELTPLHYARCKKDGLNCYTSCNRYDGFDVKDWHVHIPIIKSYANKYNSLGLGKKYVTISCDSLSHKDQMHKKWPLEYWIKFAQLFKKSFPEILLVQLGAAGAEVIDGCDCYVLGENLELTKYVLRGAIRHVATEGGLVHLASQLDTRCIVLFGPTSVYYYGYRENLNIQAGTCHDCYWFTNDWYTCYRHLAEPECMYSITPELVMEEIERECGDMLRGQEEK